MPTGPLTELVLLEHDDVVEPKQRQMVRDTAASDPAADHDRPRLRRDHARILTQGLEYGLSRSSGVFSAIRCQAGHTASVASVASSRSVDVVSFNLERHASTGAVRAYKLTSLGAVERVATTLRRPLPDLGTEDSLQLVSTIALLAGAMYQIATPPPALAELYATDPHLAHALVDLEPRLARAAQVTVAGMRARPRMPRGRMQSAGAPHRDGLSS
jgi:Tetracyclin repressor-like, C-terminal domain